MYNLLAVMAHSALTLSRLFLLSVATAVLRAPRNPTQRRAGQATDAASARDPPQTSTRPSRGPLTPKTQGMQDALRAKLSSNSQKVATWPWYPLSAAAAATDRSKELYNGEEEDRLLWWCELAKHTRSARLGTHLTQKHRTATAGPASPSPNPPAGLQLGRP